MRLILIGFGVVGSGLAQILRDKAPQLDADYGFRPLVIGVVTGSRGSLYRDAGLELNALLEAGAGGDFTSYPDSPGLLRDISAREMIQVGKANVLVEASPTNLETGQPALEYCHLALENGAHVVLANKGPVALDYAGLQAKARKSGLMLRCEATVMAGTPVMALATEGLAGCEIRSARGILNGTTNYILTQMEDGMAYADALRQAQELGFAETDPSGDVDGWDAAGKVLILANALFGSHLKMDDLDVSGISGVTVDDINEAGSAGERYKLIATATPNGGSVKAKRIPLSDPLASVGGATNAITLETDLMGAVTLIGAGAGKLETGAALLADLLSIHRARFAV